MSRGGRSGSDPKPKMEETSHAHASQPSILNLVRARGAQNTASVIYTIFSFLLVCSVLIALQYSISSVAERGVNWDSYCILERQPTFANFEAPPAAQGAVCLGQGFGGFGLRVSYAEFCGPRLGHWGRRCLAVLLRRLHYHKLLLCC